MAPDDAEEYTAALGQVVAGGWRQVALGVRLGVPKALGVSTSEWVEQRLGGYVRLSIPERRAAVAELAEDGMSQREIAGVLGIGRATVDRDRQGGPNGPPAAESPQVEHSPQAPSGPNGPPELSPEEVEQRRRAKDRADAIARDAERIRTLVTCYSAVRVLGQADPDYRDAVLDALDTDDRDDFLTITKEAPLWQSTPI